MKIFLAGTNAETKNIDDVLKSKYNLESFYYIKPWQDELIRRSEMFLLDSGAFTFFSSQKGLDWDSYIDKYCEFINTHGIDYFFELDIDPIVGYEKVKEYRKKIERKVQKRCVPVWHKSRGLDEFKRMCDEYDFVSIGGLAIGEIKPNQYQYLPSLIKIAHEKGTKVHGLGFTKVSMLKDIHFDSVDSTRWKCARFGRIEYFDGKTIVPVDRRKDNKRLVGRENNNIIKFTLQEWIKFQEYADRCL